MNLLHLEHLFYYDNVTLLLTGLIAVITVSVQSFAYRYLEGDRHYGRFCWHLALLCCSVLALFWANNIYLFVCAWLISNTLLVRLMIHKADWSAAKASGWLAARYFILGGVALTLGAVCLQVATHSVLITQINSMWIDNQWMSFALGALLVAAVVQSALWPFHKWLLSSLNAPTPVSALMHAGLYMDVEI